MREQDLLEHIFEANPGLPPSVTIPPGDDMAAIQFCRMSVLVAVDQIADGVHFDLATTPLEKVGRKAITRNLSDVAAMASLPVGAVVSAALPRQFGQERADQLFDVMRQVAQSYCCPLIGGDVTIWDHAMLLSVTIFAQPDGIRPVLRSGAQVGDVICVSGQLGGSFETIDGYAHHLDFEPRIKLARILGADPDLALHSMIDLSDGLARDLVHLCRSSDAGAVIYPDQLPISAAAHAASQRDHRPAWVHALSDGEDYELCFTIQSGGDAAQPSWECGETRITPIGRVVGPRDDKQMRVELEWPDGSKQPLEPDWGWEHG